MPPRIKKSLPALQELPLALRMAIARVMTNFNLDYPEALERAAHLIDINSKIFEERVAQEAERRYKSRFMTQVNKARGTIEKNATRRVEATFQRGENTGYSRAKAEYAIWYNCNVCNGLIYIRPSSEVHRLVIEFLRSRGWGHTACHEKSASRS